MTKDSLFAKKTSFPACTAASVVFKPAEPTIAAITESISALPNNASTSDSGNT